MNNLHNSTGSEFDSEFFNREMSIADLLNAPNEPPNNNNIFIEEIANIVMKSACKELNR
jgi:hypothetical protein